MASSRGNAKPITTINSFLKKEYLANLDVPPMWHAVTLATDAVAIVGLKQDF